MYCVCVLPRSISMKVKSQNISEIAADQINFRANEQIRQFILFQILDFSGVEMCK